jgi:hypothetical protein
VLAGDTGGTQKNKGRNVRCRAERGGVEQARKSGYPSP